MYCTCIAEQNRNGFHGLGGRSVLPSTGVVLELGFVPGSVYTPPPMRDLHCAWVNIQNLHRVRLPPAKVSCRYTYRCCPKVKVKLTSMGGGGGLTLTVITRR